MLGTVTLQTVVDIAGYVNLANNALAAVAAAGLAGYVAFRLLLIGLRWLAVSWVTNKVKGFFAKE